MMVYFNVDGLNGFKFAEFMLFMALEAIYSMILVDVRVPAGRAYFLRPNA